jgi:AcrR family transcriptional regulator
MKKDDNTTKQRLINAGIELFGKHGYSAVSTKQISEYSGINSALVSYHFGGKEKFYHAVIRGITDELIDWFQSQEQVNLDTASLSLTELREHLKVSLKHFYAWFYSLHGACGTNMFFREIISQEHPAVNTEFARAAAFITPYMYNLLTSYYTKVGKPEANVSFIWILLISVVQNISLHSNAPEEAQQAFRDAQISENMLDLILNKYA